MIGNVHKGGNGFRGIVNYLLHGKRDEPDPDRVAWAITRNMLVHDPDLAPAIMRATANQSARCLKPGYHFSISWRHDENPTDELMRMVGDSTIADLGLTEHQALMLCHKDKAHRHLHILVNRVHPGTHKAWHTGKDYERLEQSIARQAKALGMLHVPGRFNEPERALTQPRHARDGEFQKARREAKPRPLDRWSLDEIKSRKLQLGPIFEGSRSWDQLAQNLAREGLTITRKGQGLIIADAFGFMKLSDLGKEVRLGTLEANYRERFDAFNARGGNNGLLFPDQPLSAGLLTPARDVDTVSPLLKSRARPIHADGASEEDGGYDPGHELSDRERDEEEKQRLREEARQRRIVEREAELEERARRKAASSWSDADEAADAAEHSLDARTAPTPREKPVEQPDPLSDAHEELALARATLDLSYALGGLVSDAQRERARQDVEVAQEKVDANLSFADKLKADIAEALQAKPEPAPKAAPEPEPEQDEDDEMEM
ncbi:relaxase/mobilization nuclease domain-containing protein [Hyphomicrobium sp. B1]|uniref:relaxase/mobilization nuclease domain-containing protein n=1 Tax=Hyphomicrobium sp. B1 TaxID=3075651 RepID=UPI003C30C197